MEKEQKETVILIAYEDEELFDPVRPEKSLLLAILMNAISDLQKPGDVRAAAKEYFLSGEEKYIFSFKSVCNHLAVEPKLVLQMLGLDYDYPLENKIRGKESSRIF